MWGTQGVLGSRCDHRAAQIPRSFEGSSGVGPKGHCHVSPQTRGNWQQEENIAQVEQSVLMEQAGRGEAAVGAEPPVQARRNQE